MSEAVFRLIWEGRDVIAWREELSVNCMRRPSRCKSEISSSARVFIGLCSALFSPGGAVLMGWGVSGFFQDWTCRLRNGDEGSVGQEGGVSVFLQVKGKPVPSHRDKGQEPRRLGTLNQGHCWWESWPGSKRS